MHYYQYDSETSFPRIPFNDVCSETFNLTQIYLEVNFEGEVFKTIKRFADLNPLYIFLKKQQFIILDSKKV